MWVSRHEWDRLQKRVKELEERPDGAYFWYWNEERYTSLKIYQSEVLQMILNHLGLRVEKPSCGERLTKTKS